jgi:hypothetical protein
MSSPTSFPLPPEPPPPEAVSAVWVGGERQAVITFNMDIQPPGVPLDLANWKLTNAGPTKSPLSATIDGPVITLQFTATVGASQIAYDPPPFDVVAVLPNGLPAAAFSRPL